MIKLNLLPPQEKESLALSERRRWVALYGVIISSCLAIFVVLLIAVWLGNLIQLKSANTEIGLMQGSWQGQDLAAQQILLKEMESRLVKIDQFQKKQPHYSFLMEALSQSVPVGLRLEGLSIDEKGKITMAGHAQSRDQLLSFKDTLEKSPFFKNVENPLSNLVKQNDFNFSFFMDLKTDALLEK